MTAFTWKDNWSPRFHLTVDPTMDNRTKVSFAYGRFFGKIPNDLAVRALSQEKSYVVYYDLDADRGSESGSRTGTTRRA